MESLLHMYIYITTKHIAPDISMKAFRPETYVVQMAEMQRTNMLGNTTHTVS